MTQEDFQLEVDAFIQLHRITPTTFGRWAMDDSRFVFDLRNGRRCWPATMEKVRAYIRQYEAKQEAKRMALEER